MDIIDPYTAFCFDEACAYIVSELEDGKQPVFRNRYSSFSEMYKQYK